MRQTTRCALLFVVLAGCPAAGRFDRGRFEDIVNQVRARAIAPGHSQQFKVNDDLDPSSLAPVADDVHLRRGDGRGLIRAFVSPSGKLAVSIETRDNGHAGECGFLYAEDGMSTADLEAVRLESQQEERIDDHWVRWIYNLD